MKRCPECRRDYTDETLIYCLDDGNPLVEGPGTAEAADTAIFTSADRFAESSTRVLTGGSVSGKRSAATRLRISTRALPWAITGILAIGLIGLGIAYYSKPAERPEPVRLFLIGVGGMGEVYRATDPKIGRDVAIKVMDGLDAVP